jgi:hypothetical protein
MNLTDIYRAVTRLLDTGWTIPEIELLSHFRNTFQQTRDDLPDFNLDIRRLEFIRWLFQTGKLSDW